MAFPVKKQGLTPERKACIDGILASYQKAPTKMLEILLDIQASCEEQYITEPVAYYVAEQMQVKVTQVYDVISFFSSLHQTPRAKYPIQVCSSIVCSVNNSDGLMANLKAVLGKGLNEPTYDGRFIIEEVPCFGACDVAPAMRINGVVYGNLTTKEQIVDILKTLE